MARQHRERYANMADVLVDLDRIESGKAPLGPHASLNVRRLWARASRPLAIAACAVIILLGCLLGYRWFTKRPQLEVVRTIPLPPGLSRNGASIGDWNGDRAKDIFFTENDRLQIISSQGHYHRPVALKEPHTTGITLSMVADITGDGLDEAFVSWANGSNAFLAAINRMGWPVKKFRFDGSVGVQKYWGTNQTSLRAMSIVDLDRDGHMELLASAKSTWSKRPRGLCCFDLESAKLKWFFETAPLVTEIQTVDLNGDGKLGIVIGSNSPNNGSELPDGTDDSHSYVFAVSATGELLWRREAGGRFCDAMPIAKGEGKSTVLAWVTSAHEYREAEGKPELGKVLEYGFDGEVRHRYDAGVQLMSCLSSDLDEDGKREILLTDRLGFLHVLNEELRLDRKVQLVTNRFPVVELRLAGVVAIGAGKTPKLLLTSWQVENRTGFFPGNKRDVPYVCFHHDNEVLIVDAKFRIVARHQVTDEWAETSDLRVHVLPAKNGGEPEILALSDKMKYLRVIRR